MKTDPDTALSAEYDKKSTTNNPLPASIQWQPTLIGSLIRLRPLSEDDFDSLFSIASDPLLWEQHPEPERYKRENFTRFFRQGIESNGALVIIDQKNGQIIGSSRFTLFDPAKASVEVGYTFLSRSYWGQGHNRELKLLMLNYAFQFVESVFFVVGDMNHRSQKAMAGIGAIETRRAPSKIGSYAAIIYEMTKSSWAAIGPSIASHFVQPSILQEV